MILGTNSFFFDDFAAAVPGSTGRRVYRDQVDYVPSAWPYPEDHVTMSLRPNLAKLLAGQFDEQIKHLCSTVTAAEKAQLTIWHEAGSIVGRDGYVWTPDQMRRAHDHMMRLCAGTNVSYGINIDGSAVRLRPWLTAVDWYGADIYDGPAFRYNHDLKKGIDPDSVASQLGELRQAARQLTGKKFPQIDVCESNARDAWMRPPWFRIVADWLAQNGGRRLLTHWADDGPMSGPWLPHDAPTINALRGIISKYGSS